MKALRTLSLVAIASATVAGCYNTKPMPVNAPPEAHVNPAIAATPAGNMATGMGGVVGGSMDGVDHVKLNQALETSRTNQSSSWTNPSSHITYSVTPTRTFNSPTGAPCRDFTNASVANGQTSTVYGTACRDANGQWHVVSS